MNVDRILQTLNEHEVKYLLIGGLNFYFRHKPVATYDVDLWIEDSEANRRRCELALAELNAEWGTTDEDWGPVENKPAGWLDIQSVYCLNCPDAPVDVFRNVTGLPDWETCAARAVLETVDEGIEYLGLADVDMLKCQLLKLSVIPSGTDICA